MPVPSGAMQCLVCHEEVEVYHFARSSKDSSSVSTRDMEWNSDTEARGTGSAVSWSIVLSVSPSRRGTWPLPPTPNPLGSQLDEPRLFLEGQQSCIRRYMCVVRFSSLPS